MLLVSFPKSGRTWIRYAAGRHGLKLRATHADADTGPNGLGKKHGTIPEALKSEPLIFLHRNPIDTAVSMFYQVHFRSVLWKKTKNRLKIALLRGSPPKAIDPFVLHPRYGVENVCRFNRAWLDHLAGREDCLVVSYETLRAAPEAGFQQILDFCGRTDVVGADLAEASDFERMRSVERGMSDDERSVHLGLLDRDNEASAKVRRGVVYGFYDELKPETVAAAKAIAARYGFPYSD
ncbi:MAG: sulfotransferase domain-containing protein [Pseudomonadota bacterium]